METNRKRPTTEEAEARLLRDIQAAKPKHTPGPWKIHMPSEFFDSIPDNADFQIEFGPGDWGGFWVVEHNGIDRTDSSYHKRTSPHADALLIAAAPELLAACKEAKFLAAHGIGAVNLSEDSWSRANSDRNIGEIKRIMAIIDAAIAKAEGGAG